MKRKYLLFMIGFLLTYILGTALNYFTAEWFLITTGFFPNTFEHRIEMSNYNTRWGMIIATIALGIKISKNWYLQQKENLEILRRKSKIEMQSEKARIHPELLLRSLDTIHYNIEQKTDKAPFLILNLSDILSHSLYENETVSLENEIAQLQNLISLENGKKEKCSSIELSTTGNLNQKITSMTLVKILEGVISNLYKTKTNSCLLQLNLIVSSNVLLLSFVIQSAVVNNLQEISWPLIIENIEKVLNHNYNADNYKIELKNERESVVVHLQLQLLETLHNPVFISNSTQTLS